MCRAALGSSRGWLAPASLALSSLFTSASTHAQNDELDALFGPAETPAKPSPSPTPSPSPSISLNAQTPPPVLRTSPAALEEIIVTAQRREESLQDTPISISALGEDELTVGGIGGLADIGASVPSLQIEPFPTSNATLRFYIRGMGIIDAQITQDPAIGVYADGVYIARSTGTAFEVADLERIEVLRGPQGTLYGRNTIGGAINLVTRRPDVDETSFRQDVTVGDRNRIKLKSVLNVPLADNLAVKLALAGSQIDGYVENLGPGGDYGDRRSVSGRLDVRWFPADAWTVDYSYDRSEIDFYNYQYQAVLTPEGDKGQLELIKREAQANSVFSDTRLNALATGMPLEESGTLINGHALTVQRTFEHFDLKYIGAYRDLKESFYTDLGGGAGSTAYRLDTHRYDGPAATSLQGGPTPLVIPFIAQDQSSHELQIVGSTPTGHIDYVAGLFWFEESAVEDWQPMVHQFSAAANPVATTPGLGELVSALGPRLVAFNRIFNEIENDSSAVFGQATWTPQAWQRRLHLTLGYRYSRDKRFARKTKQAPTFVEINQGGQGIGINLGNPLPLPSNPLTDLIFDNVSLAGADTFDAVPGQIEFSDSSFSFVSAFDYSDDSNLYAKYVEAYKSGGFNTRDPHIDGNNEYGFGFGDGFDKEKVRSWEIGLKSLWLQRRLRLNASAFYTDYRDMQINFILAGTVSDTKTTNAGKARMWGLETDASVVLSHNLRLSGSYAYLNADITQVTDALSGENVANQYQFNSAPEHSVAAHIDWTFAHLQRTSLTLNLGYQYTSAREGGANAGAPVDLPAFDLVNAYLGTSPAAWGRWQISAGLWVRNLLDSDHEISAIDNLPHADRAVLWNEPRTYGLDLRVTF